MLFVKMSVRRIARFIESGLVEKVRKDQWDYKIGNERDLEHSIYYHLRNFIKKTDRVKISSNYTISGYSISKQKKSKKTKKLVWKKSGFIMPDILISFIPVGQKQLDHKIAIELKAAKPWRSYSIDHLSNRNIHKDFKILNILKQSHEVNYSYFFYLFSHETKNESEVRKQILNSRFKVNKKNNAKKKYFKPLVINRFLDPKTKKITKDIDERKEKSSRIFRSYEGQDPRFSKNTKNDKRKSLQSLRMSLRAYKAHLSRKRNNPEKFGRVTQDLLDNIKRLEKILNS